MARKYGWLALLVGSIFLAWLAFGQDEGEQKSARTDLDGSPLPAKALARSESARLREEREANLDSLAMLPVPLKAEEKQPPRKDAHGDPLPSQALARFGTIRWRKSWDKEVTLFFTPAGAPHASGYDRAGIGLWNAETGEKLHHLPLDVSHDASLARSADGALMAVSDRDHPEVRLYDLKTGKLQRTVPMTRDDHLKDLVLSPDGRYLATAHFLLGKDAAPANLETLVRVWDMTSGKELRRFRQADFPCVFTPDNKTLLIGGDKHMCIWDIPTWKEQRRLEGEALRMALSTDGRMLAVRGRGIVRLWDPTTGEERRTLTMRDEKFDLRYDTLALSDDGKTVVVAGSGYLFAWDTATGKEILPLKDHHGTPVAISPDGRKLAWISKPVICQWDLVAGREIPRPAGHEGGVSALSFSADGRTLLSGGDRTLRLWKIGEEGKEKGPPQTTVIRFKDWPIVASPDGRVCAVGGEKEVFLHEISTGKLLRTLTGAQHCYPLSFSPDGTLLAGVDRDNFYKGSGNSPGQVCIWEVASGTLVRKIEGHGPHVSPIAFSPDGKRLATCSEMVQVWDISTGEELLRFRTGDRHLESAAFSTDGKFLATGGEALVIWDLASGAEKLRVADTDYFECLAIAPSGRHVATGGRAHVVRLWNMDTGDELARFSGHTERVEALAFSPDGKLLASGSDDTTILLWDVAAALKLAEIKAKEKPAPADLNKLWAVLAEEDAHFAHQAVWAMIGEPERAVAFLQEHLKPPPEKETEALCVPKGEMLRSVRAVQVLERIDSKESRQLLQKLTSSESARIAKEAKDALARLEQLHQPPPPLPKKLSPAERQEQLWKNLGEADATLGHKTIWALVRERNQAVAFLGPRLKPIEPADAKRVARLIADLDDDRFAVRDKAYQELEKYGELAQAALVKALEGKPSLEARRRIERLLRQVDASYSAWPTDQLRTLRALTVLERIGTPAAKRVLEKMASGAPESRLTQEAQKSLERLNRGTTLEEPRSNQGDKP